MVKMVLGSSDAQGQTMSSVGKARVTAYNSAVTALSNFNGAGDLQGSAYDSGKQYGVSVITPLIKGAIMYSEYLSEAVPKLPSKYRSEVGDEDLDSAVLEREIQSLESSISSLRGTFRAMEGSDHADKSLLQNISSRMDSLTSQKNEKMDKLRKLNLFAGSSNEVFSGEGAKSMDTVAKNLASGLNMIQGDFASFGGTFPKHSGKTLNWAKSIEGEWDKKAKIDEDYQKVLEKTESGKELNENDIKVSKRYMSRYPNRQIPEKLQKIIDDYDKKQESENKVWNPEKFIYEKVTGLPENFMKELALNRVGDAVEKKVVNKGVQKAAEESAKIRANRFSIKLKDGRIMGKTPGATKAAMEATEETIESSAKFAGKAFSNSIGLIAGIGIDIIQGNPVDSAIGSGIVTTGAALAVEGLAGLALGTAGLPVLASIGIGVGVGIANDFLRETIPAVKDFEDNVGKAVVAGWNGVVNVAKGLFSW